MFSQLAHSMISEFGMPKTDRNCLEFKFRIWSAIAWRSWMMGKAFWVGGMMERSEASTHSRESWCIWSMMLIFMESLRSQRPMIAKGMRKFNYFVIYIYIYGRLFIVLLLLKFFFLIFQLIFWLFVFGWCFIISNTVLFIVLSFLQKKF